MTILTDTHIHLSDEEYDSNIPIILHSMKKLNLKACCVSMDYQTSLKTLNLAKKSDLILPFIGIHPEHAQTDFESTLDLIKQNSDNISGIGEIGLDKTLAKSPEELKRQELVFRSQLSLAEKLQKPVSIHSRKSLDEIYEIISSYSLNHVALHWFDGSKNALLKAMDRDFFVSYGPVLLYAKDKQVLLENTNEEKILVETDGPVRFSHCFGFKTAQVTFIPSVVFCASNVLCSTYNEISKILEDNSNRFLGI